MYRLALAILIVFAAALPAAAKDDDRNKHKAYHVPPGHMPPPGMCRIWFPDRPPGHQPAPGACNVLAVRVPHGGYLVRGGYAPQPRQTARATYIEGGSCDRALLGGIVGGVGGALIGNQFGKGDGRTVATIGGAILGVIVGGAVGNSMDQADHGCVGKTLDHADDNEPIAWNNPSNGAQYQVTPVRTASLEDGRYCREYLTRVTIAGREEQAYGRACRQPDGSWQTVN